MYVHLKPVVTLLATRAIVPLELDAAASDKERLRIILAHACELLVDIDSTGLFAAPVREKCRLLANFPP